MRMKATVVIVEDEITQGEFIAGFLKQEGYALKYFPDPNRALEWIRANETGIALTDYRMPGLTGEELLVRIKKINPEIQVILMTAYGNVEGAVRAMRAGAFNYIQKPVDLDNLLSIIKKAEEHLGLMRENRQLRRQIEEQFGTQGFIAKSAAMKGTLHRTLRVAPTDATVLILGESGTGKERIARIVHERSVRRNRPFVPVNCAALPESLVESELFGHVKGSFTGASADRRGRFLEADEGTLFLDEIGDVPPAIQVKLLRAIQEGTIDPVGRSKSLKVDVRLVAATHRDLEALCREGKFREDLFYRLSVFRIEIPPLRERREDIAVLLDHYLQVYARSIGRDVRGFSSRARDVLMRYDYPGNIRELQNIIEGTVIMADRELIETRDLPPVLNALITNRSPEDSPDSLSSCVAALERKMIRDAMARSDNVKTQAAKLLGVHERVLRYKLDKYGME